MAFPRFLRKLRGLTCSMSVMVVLVVIILTTAQADPAAAKLDKKKKLDFAEVQQIVRRHFAVIEEYRPGDLITQQIVEELFKQLDLYGWKVADKQAILGQVLADGDFLAQQFRTPQGRQFMRQISGLPEGYDRVDRIASMPQGHGNIAQMIKMPGGYEMIQAMTTTHRGKILGQRLSNTPKGKDFNKPTGRIYTEDQLLARLKESFEKRAK